ncbi:MAG: ABC transporter ATP-binding protein [Nitrospira sp.]|nr:ABC transporter ATP-binding protein [Nitrospira sp.]
MASLVLENVTIDFPIYGSQKTFRHALFEKTTGGFIRREGTKNQRVTVRALENISLNLSHGDRLGMIGHNGAGKSTLLRVCAGVYEPTYGKISINGKVSPLFSTSPGLDGDDTGYENIQTCGMFLGMTPEEIVRKTPEIEQFSELGDYLSLPVRTYSTGMLVRLGFGIATSIDPEILLLDEGLGAGDARFAERANKRVDALVERASILVLASHSDALIKTMCNKAILLQGGRVIASGSVDEVIKEYHDLNKSVA